MVLSAETEAELAEPPAETETEPAELPGETGAEADAETAEEVSEGG